MSRIFITGATGYIGGDVLHALTQSSSSISKIVALVRDEMRACRITAKYPSVTAMVADLDSTTQIEQEAAEADVVLNLANSKHLGSASAIAKGLSESKRPNPVWIQISGASVVSGPDISSKAYGEARAQDHDDLHGISEIRDIIASSPQRAVDNLLVNLSSTQPQVRTAMIYGPLIYGLGRGPINQRSVQVPDLAKATLQRGHGVQVGKGLSCWSNVHISDLAQLIVRLVQEAASPSDQPLWNQNGIYFAENGKLPFGEISKQLASFAFEKGFIKSASVEDINPDNADEITAHGAVLLGTNAQYKASRARELLGWKPTGPSLEEEIPRALLEEVSRTGGKI